MINPLPPGKANMLPLNQGTGNKAHGHFLNVHVLKLSSFYRFYVQLGELSKSTYLIEGQSVLELSRKTNIQGPGTPSWTPEIDAELQFYSTRATRVCSPGKKPVNLSVGGGPRLCQYSGAWLHFKPLQNARNVTAIGFTQGSRSEGQTLITVTFWRHITTVLSSCYISSCTHWFPQGFTFTYFLLAALHNRLNRTWQKTFD